MKPGAHAARLVLLVTALSSPFASGQELPARLDDEAFWGLVTGLSEESGRFPGQYMSNEDSALFVVPELRERIPPGGVYIGVGSEQNFTYIAAIDPRMAFVVDIRRDNMIQHLAYKAIFELSSHRGAFVSRVFSLPEPDGIDADADVETLFAAFARVEGGAEFFEENLAEVEEVLVGDHGFSLDAADREALREIMTAMWMAGPTALQGFGDETNPSYARLMAATDLRGDPQSYLSSEARFGIVRDLEMRNLVVPLVGDFAGDGALPGVGDYLREHGAVADVFYLSNVERYLFDQGPSGMRFYENVRSLPLGPSSLFVRSVTSDISYRLGIPIPDQPTKWRTFLFSIQDCLRDFADGLVSDYRALFDMGFADSVNQP